LVARARTLAQIRTTARQRSDRTNDDTISGFVGNVELNEYINASYAWFYATLVKSGFIFFESIQTIVTAGVENVAVSADYFATIGVDWKLDASSWVGVPEAMIQERNLYPATGSRALAYRLSGNNLKLLPVPPSGQTYRHIYVPTCPVLVLDSDTVDGMMGWEELLIEDVARKFKVKEGSDVGAHERAIAVMLRRIEDESQLRAINQPRRVIDIYEDNLYDPSDWRWWE